MSGESIKVLLADEQTLFRQLLRMAMEAEADFEVAEAYDGPSTLAEGRRIRADVAVIDAALRGFDAVEATKRIGKELPSCRVLVVCTEPDERVLLELLRAGGYGYLTKSCLVAELIFAVRGVYRGELQIQREMLRPLVDRLLHRWQKQEEAVRRISRLSRREREVLRHLAHGSGTTQIAQSLVLTPDTVRTHIQNVMEKLGVHSRVDAATFVARNQVLEDLGWILQ
jgi:DNA-binding NarL/FixJ family response regulator